MEKEVYLKLTEDDVVTITCALRSQYNGGDNLNFIGSENDDLIAKIYSQEGTICRPFVVTGVHDNGASYINKKVVVMATNIEDAIDSAKNYLEKHSDDWFAVKPEDVHEMTDNEFIVEVC